MHYVLIGAEPVILEEAEPVLSAAMEVPPQLGEAASVVEAEPGEQKRAKATRATRGLKGPAAAAGPAEALTPSAASEHVDVLMAEPHAPVAESLVSSSEYYVV